MPSATRNTNTNSGKELSVDCTLIVQRKMSALSPSAAP